MSLNRSNHQTPQVVVPNRVKHVSANHIICFIDRLSGIGIKETVERTGLSSATVRDYAIMCSTYLRQSDINLSIYGQWQRALMPAAIRAVAIHLAKGTKEVVIKYMEGNGLWSKNVNIQAVSLTASVAELKASINAEAGHDPSVQAALSDIQGALSDDPGALGEALDGTVIDDEGMMHVERSAPPPGVTGDVPEGSALEQGSPGRGGREIGSSLTSKNSEKKVIMDKDSDDRYIGPTMGIDPRDGKTKPIDEILPVMYAEPQSRVVEKYTKNEEQGSSGVVCPLPGESKAGVGIEAVRNDIRNSPPAVPQANPSGDDPRSMSTTHESASTTHCLASPDVSRETVGVKQSESEASVGLGDVTTNHVDVRKQSQASTSEVSDSPIRNDIRNPLTEKAELRIVEHDSPKQLTMPQGAEEIVRKAPEPKPKDLYTGLKVGENFIDANGMKRKVTGVNPLESKLLRRKMRRGVNGHDRGKKTRRAKK